MSIINRLNPQVRELMEKDTEKYPSLVGKMEREMREAFVPTDLSVVTAQTLIGYFDQLGLKAKFDNFVIKLYTMFEDE
jgi:hypothetical protein